MNYQQPRRFSPVPAALAVLATVATLAFGVVLPAQFGGSANDDAVLARAATPRGLERPVVTYQVDVVGVREAAMTEGAHVKEAARRAS